MLGSTLKKLVLVAVLTAAGVSLPTKSADACWGWKCRHGWYCGCSTCVSYPVVYRPVVYRPVVYRPVFYSSVDCCPTYVVPAWRGCRHVHLNWRGCCSTCGVYVSRPCCGVYAPEPCCGEEHVVVPANPPPAAAPPAKPPKGKPANSVLRPKTDEEGGTLAPPVNKNTVPAPPVAKPANEDSTLNGIQSSALLAVEVPSDAKVLINGLETRTRGTERRYLSQGLIPGYRYAYEIQAILVRDGQELTETQTVRVRGGETSRVAFDFEQPTVAKKSVPAQTTLTLNVPEDAQVVLAGNPTSASGAVRRFTTKELARGQNWENYRIEVSAERNGQRVTEEKTIRLAGGDSLTLSFELQDAKLAQR